MHPLMPLSLLPVKLPSDSVCNPDLTLFEKVNFPMHIVCCILYAKHTTDIAMGDFLSLTVSPTFEDCIKAEFGFVYW